MLLIFLGGKNIELIKGTVLSGIQTFIMLFKIYIYIENLFQINAVLLNLLFLNS